MGAAHCVVSFLAMETSVLDYWLNLLLSLVVTLLLGVLVGYKWHERIVDEEDEEYSDGESGEDSEDDSGDEEEDENPGSVWEGVVPRRL